MASENQLLDWINFGKVSAERDDLLSKYFFDDGVLASVIASQTSFLILGRKGAGKTAVFRYLSENNSDLLEKGDILVSLSFDDYNWNVHSLLSNQQKSESLLYKQSWRLVILVECLKAYLSWCASSGMTPPKAIANAGKLIEKLFGTPIPSLTQLIGKKILSLSRLKLPTAGLDLEGGDLDSLSISGGEASFEDVQANPGLKQSLSENIDHLITVFSQAVSKARTDWPRIFICFDRVDEAWDKDSFESAKKVIAGLVTASDSITAEYGGRIRPLVFLREDIFDVLSINDANKLREDCGALLHWRAISLQNMILRRVNYFADQAGAPSVNSFDGMFDRQEMRQRLKPSKYLMKRTMMRPRDLISILGRVVETMKEKRDDPFQDEVPSFSNLECESIYAAEPGYSEWLKKELLDEWATQKPEIENLFAAIQNNGSTNFTRADLQEHLKKLGVITTTAEIISHLRFLFDNSIIGFKLGASAEWRFKCFYPSQGFVESEEYRAHEGLVRALNLTEPRARDASGD